MKSTLRGKFISKNIKDTIISTIESVGNFSETHVILFDTQTFDFPLKIINKETQRITIVEGDKNYHRWQVSSLDKWKLNNNAIEDKNYMNANKHFPSVMLASKCVLNANVEDIFNTTQKGKRNSETFVNQILQFNSNDYIKKNPNETFKFERNKQIPYSKNTVFVTASRPIISQKHCINYLKDEACAFYSQKESVLLSPKTKISFITFINPELFGELFSTKNNFTGASKTAIRNSLFFNTLFNINDIGSFRCDEFNPNMILPKYTTTSISKLEKNNIDPNLIKGILIQPKSIDELKSNQLYINETFIIKLNFLLSILTEIKNKETIEDVFKRMFKTYPNDINLSSKFWSIPLNKWLKFLPRLLNEPLTVEMDVEFKKYCLSLNNVKKKKK